MDKPCGVCCKTAKYKCPKCFIYYCSISCCNEHKKNNCEKKNASTNKSQDVPDSNGNKKDIDSNFAVPITKLQLLGENDDLRKLLANPHLRNLLVAIDKTENVETLMHEAMQEPIFTEFADVCLQIIDPVADKDNG